MSTKVADLNVKVSYEDAISATKFGKFNLLLIIAAIPGGMVPILDNTVMSYVIPVAQCDLDLSLQQKGLLNSAAFIGLVLGCYIWGFLGDTLGRKKTLFIAYLIDFSCNIIDSFSHEFWTTLFFRIFCGFAGSGPYSVLFAYISEFHSAKYRSKVIFVIGLCMASTLLVLPSLGWVIIPLPDLHTSFYVLHSWQYFMIIVALFPFISMIFILFLPETPKYLMTMGRNDDALRILQKIYKWNTGKPKEEYPIKELKDENGIADTANNKDLTMETVTKKNLLQLLHGGFMQIKFLFQMPHSINITLTVFIHFGILMGANTLRLWLPQIFTSINEYNEIHGNHNGSICEVLIHSFRETASLENSTALDAECVVAPQNDNIYINSILIGVGSYIGNIFIIIIINYCIKKYVLFVLVTITGLTSLGIYWCKNQLSLVIVSTINISIAIISSTTLLSLTVEIFPTSLRAMAVSITVMAGQIGALIGNIIFPDLLQLGCLPPFLFLGVIVLVAAITCFKLPNPKASDFK